MTTVASGRWTSLPADVETAIGANPSAATVAVRSSGWSTAVAPWTIAVSGAAPAARRRRISLAMTTPLSTAMPQSAMKPTAAGRLNDIPRAASATTPPMSHVRPLVEAFFAWVETRRAAPRERGVLSTALGYVHHQRDALCRFLDDGRLRLENNAAERGLRPIATGRKAWLFFGSDDHAQAAANLFSLLAGCKLHGLDPGAYLAEVVHVMAWWPRDRYLELCPRDWARTRARLDPAELAHEIGPITVPAPLPAPEQGSPN